MTGIALPHLGGAPRSAHPPSRLGGAAGLVALLTSVPLIFVVA
jgi:hypothetical protein